MLTVTTKATALLKAAKDAQGAPPSAGIRIGRGSQVDNSGNGSPTIGVAISEGPGPEDQTFEQDGLRIFIEDMLIEPLGDRTLDVQEASDGPELVLL